MKALARSYVWWPGLDQDIVKKVKSCDECQAHQSTPAEAPLHPREWPGLPWSRLHIDYAGPYKGVLTPCTGVKTSEPMTREQSHDICQTRLLKPGFHIIAPVAAIATVVEKRVSATVAIYGNTLFSGSSDKYDSGDERR